MAIQMLGKVKYSPARDVYHILPNTIKTVAEYLMLGQPFKPLHGILAAYNIRDVDLEQAVAAYVKFMTISQTEEGVKFTDALDRSGWLAVNPVVQIGLMYYVGVVQSGVFFEGCQMGFAKDQEQTTGMQNMLQTAADLAAYVHAPWWKRWWLRRTYARRPVVFRG